MRKTRIHIRVDGDGLIIDNAKGANIDENLRVICHKITDSTGVTFSEGIYGNADDEDGQLKVLFSEEISEEKGDEIDNLLSDLNGSTWTLIPVEDPEEVSRAAREVYHLFNDYILIRHKLEDVPETAMVAWYRLRDSIVHV